MGVTVSEGSLQWTADIDTSLLRKKMAEVQNIMGGIEDKARSQADAIDGLARKAAAGFAAYLSVNVATDFIGQMVRVRGEFQQLEVAFTTMLGSKEKADKLLADVTRFAATTPFELTEVAAATKKLLAFGIAAEDIETTLRQLGDVSAGIGAPIGEIAYLFGTIKTQGVALTQDVRQFAQRGIPVYEELAKVLKVSVDQVDEFITAGKVGFPEIQKVFENLTGEGSKFGGLMNEQAKTLTGQISNLQDAVARMFNELGKANQGVFADVISGLTFVVENFQTVIDIIKLLIIAYGSYRAAIIITNTVTAVATALNEGLTLSLIIQARVTQLVTAAQKLLNVTMLKNPAALVAATIITLVSALLIFRKTSSQVKTANDLLADSQERVGDKMAEAKAKIQPYVDQLKKANLSEAERLDIYKKLQAIDPKIVAGIDAKKLSYQSLTENVNKYLGALREQFKLEANKEAIQASIKQETILEEQLRDRIAAVEKYKKIRDDASKLPDLKGTGNDPFVDGLPVSAAIQTTSKEVIKLNQAFHDQRAVTEGLGQKVVAAEGDKTKAVERTIAVIDAEIKKLRDDQTAFSKNSAEYQQYQKQITALEEERKRITGASKSDISAGNKLENERNSLLEKRADILLHIGDLERDAQQTGLTEKAKAIDAINEKYDKQLRAIQETNRELAKFNKKNKAQPIPLIGQGEIDRINQARALEQTNLKYREDATNYIDAVKLKQKAFDEYQNAVLNGSALIVEKIKQVYKADLEGFGDYVSFIQNEIDSLKTIKALNLGDAGTDLKIEELTKLLADAQKKADEAAKEQQKNTFQEMLKELNTFNQQRADINKKYNELEKSLEDNKGSFSEEELAKRRQLIKEGREADLTTLENDIVRQSDLYKKLNLDIIRYTRKQIEELIRQLKEILRTSVSLTPEMKEAIQGVIDKYEDLLDTTNETAKDFSKLGESLGDISNIFSDLAGGVEGLNDSLAGTLSTMGELVQVASDAATSIAQFASGDIVGGIGSAVKAITGIFNIGKRARESRRKAEAEIAAFQLKVLQGEIDVNVLYRQRQVEQSKINKLKLEGIKAETEALKKAREQNVQDYARIFALIQNESFISGQKKKKSGGVLGFGATTSVKNELSSLTGLNFDQMEKLFMEGKLTDRAKELFETLQKLKEEGLDIDAAIEQSRQELKEALTGTTADSIAASIIEGFKQGKRSASDFADDFQGFMQQALFQALQFRALEGPLNDFFDQFAAEADSGGQLDAGEIERLQSLYNSIIENAADQFEQIQSIAGLNASGNDGGSGSALTGAIRGMTEQTAELLAGQFSGLRITAIEQLRVAQTHLQVTSQIEANTARLVPMLELWRRLERDGLKVI